MMEMASSDGVPWLDSPVMLHGSRESSCDLTPAQCAYRSQRFHNWYMADWVYALGTIYYFVATIGFCTAGYWILLFAPSRLRRSTLFQKVIASVRFLAYQHFEIKPLKWRSNSVGVGILLCLGFLYFMAMTLGPKPYYWPTDVAYGDSPPLATRSGWMSLACLPFMMILPTQANMIGSITGVSHERLIVFHKWVGWAMFVLALLHMVPFIVHNMAEGTMAESWNSSVVWWTGVVAIIAQAWLQFMSVSWIRNRFYEFFKATHYLFILVFVLFLFFHCDFILSSWDYFIATGVLYTLQFLYSQIRTYFEYGVSRRAQFTILSPADEVHEPGFEHKTTIKVTIPVDSRTAFWTPGQHVFLRFLTLGAHALTAHPFTIGSLPSHPRSLDNDDGKARASSKMVFYVEARGGITARIAGLAAKNPGGFSAPVLLDGPYGGLKIGSFQAFDRRLVIAAGAGVPFAIPFVLENLIFNNRRMDHDNQRHNERNMQVVLISRDARMITCFQEAITDYMEENGLEPRFDNCEISFYLTRTAPGKEATDSDSTAKQREATTTVVPTGSETRRSEHDSEKLAIHSQPIQKRTSSMLESFPMQVHTGPRPDLEVIINQATAAPEKQQGRATTSIGIAACGPSSVLQRSSEAAVKAQRRILNGTSGVGEVYLHTEHFSW